MGNVEYRPFREPRIQIGFWRDTQSVLDWSGLPDPRERVDPNWSLGEREAIAAYLDSGKTFESWMGMSYCRFDCGVFLTGNRDLTDGTYVWPEDLSHYIRVHSVRLPKEFLDHVLTRRPK